MLIGGLVVGTVVRQPSVTLESQDVLVPPDVEEVLEAIFKEDRCVTAREADAAVRGGLVRVNRESWTVTWGLGVGPGSCVGYDFLAEESIGLLPALSPELRNALDRFRERTFTECLTEEQATDALRLVVTGEGERGFLIQADGPVGAPPERFDEVMRHVEAGCFVYSTTGISEDGVRVFYLAGER